MSRSTGLRKNGARSLVVALVAALTALGTGTLAAPGAAAGPAGPADPASPARPVTVAYVEVNDHELRTVGDYELADGSNVFDIAIIFAANINHGPSGPYLHLNDQVQATLDDAATQVRPLQAKGIKVTLSLLGNHQAAGFANFRSRAEADKFAKQVAQVVETYGLDGVDIDDEWVRYGTDGVPAAKRNSATWLVNALDSRLPEGSIISLYDIGESAAQLKAAPAHVLDKIDYIWNPYYGQYNVPQFPGVSSSRLGPAAVDLSQTSADRAARLAARTVDEGYGVFVTYNLRAGDHSSYVSSFTRELYGQDATYTG